MKYFRYWIEHLLLLILHGFCKILPWRWASALFGKIAEILGSHMGMNRKAVRHIRAALNISDDAAKHIAKAHWNNLGRVMAEYPHLDHIIAHHVEFRGAKYLEQARDDNMPGIFFSAHLANWEVVPLATLHHYNIVTHPIYRAPNNPMVDRRLLRYRSANEVLTPYPKSRQGMVGMVKALKSGEHLGLLVDQKYNEGVDAPFFGMNAKTGTAFIELAQKYDCPLLPIRCIRKKQGGFIVDIGAPVPVKDRDVMAVLTDVHHILEDWIKEYPEQWLWVHRRWKQKDLKNVSSL